MNTKCTKCGAGLDVDDEVRGQIETCPACGAMFEVPLVERSSIPIVPTLPPAFDPKEPAPTRAAIGSGPVIKGGGPPTTTLRGSAGNVIAGVASFVIPGLGQICQLRGRTAIGFLICWIVGIVFFAAVAGWLGGTVYFSFFLGGLWSIAFGFAAAWNAAAWDGKCDVG